MGKEMHIIVLSIAFVVISSIHCKSIHKKRSIVNFPVEEEEAGGKVVVTGSAGEDSPRAIPDAEIHEDATAAEEPEREKLPHKARETFEIELLHQKNKNQRVRRSSASDGTENSKRGKKKNKRRRNRFQPTVIHVEAKYTQHIPPSIVSYDAKGKIDSTWNLAVREGRIGFDESGIIKIQKTGLYEVYSSMRFRYNNTSHGLSHCIGELDEEGHLKENERLACSFNPATKDDKGIWENNGQVSTKGYYCLREGMHIGVGINTFGDRAPRGPAIAFVRDQCYFGARLVSGIERLSSSCQRSFV